MSSTRFLLSRAATLLAATCLIPVASHAAEGVSFRPSLKQDFSYESNPLLLIGPHEDLYGSVTTPELVIYGKTPTSELDMQLALTQNIFNESEFNSTDWHGDLDFDHEMQRWGIGLTAASDYDTTRTSEITTLNLNTGKAVRHWLNQAAPYISFKPAEAHKIKLTGSYLSSSYDSTIFTDYEIYSVTPSYSYEVDPLNTAEFSVATQRYQADDALDSHIDSVVPRIGWDAKLTPRLSVKASVGAEFFRQDNDGGTLEPEWKVDPVYAVDVSYRTERDVLTLRADKILTPYANGTQGFLNNVTLTEERSLTPHLTGQLGLGYHFTSGSDLVGSNLEALSRASAALAYHVTETLDITGSYQYRYQSLENIPGHQTDSRVLIGLSWRPTLEGRHD